MGHFPATFSFIFCLSQTNIKFYQQINVNNVYPVYGAGIWTHNLHIVGLIP